MGFNFKKTKLSAYCQIVLGLICLSFGVFDRFFIYTEYVYAFHTKGVIVIWTGAWFLITGIIGYYASQPYPNTQRPKMGMINTYLEFSIVATVFAGVNATVGLSYIARGSHTSIDLGAMIIIFAIEEFGVSIWASVCCCMGHDGCCCDTSPPQMDQVHIVYLQTQGHPVATYVMPQGPNGMPVAVPAMTGEPVYPVPNQAVGGQAYMMQNPQDATAQTTMQYVQGVDRQVYAQNPQAATTVTSSLQGITTYPRRPATSSEDHRRVQ